MAGIMLQTKSVMPAVHWNEANKKRPYVESLNRGLRSLENDCDRSCHEFVIRPKHLECAATMPSSLSQRQHPTIAGKTYLAGVAGLAGSPAFFFAFAFCFSCFLPGLFLKAGSTSGFISIRIGLIPLPAYPCTGVPSACSF